MNRAYFCDHVNVRAGPSVETEKVAQYHPGERVNYDGVVGISMRTMRILFIKKFLIEEVIETV